MALRARRRSRAASLTSLGGDDDLDFLAGPVSEISSDLYGRLNSEKQTSLHVAENTPSLENVTSLEDVYAMFGLKKQDRTTRRDQIKMWETIRENLIGEISRLTHSGKVDNYDKAKRMHKALHDIRRGFEAVHTEEIHRSHSVETTHFDTAKRKLQSHLALGEAHRISVETSKDKNLRDDLAENQAIERENRQFGLRIAPPPKLRWSKRILELQQAEHALSKLHRYDEAKNVRKMLDKLEGPEQRKQLQNFQSHIARGDARLKQGQDDRSKRLHEKLGELKWANLRKAHREAHRQKQRLLNLNLDMGHVHAMERHAKPELVVHPSLLLEKRKHYHHSSAATHGSRLLHDVLRGGDSSTTSSIYVQPLCPHHDFERPLSGTVLLDHPTL